MSDSTLNVPYWSQYLDIADGKNAPRSCGITCAKMILDLFSLDEGENLENLVNIGFEQGGFGSAGWKHDYFVQLFIDKGLLGSFRMEKMNETDDVAKLAESIESGFPVIVSTERRMFNDRSFHMVVLTGTIRDESGQLQGFFYSDPAKLDRAQGSSIRVELSTFLNYWRKMAIFPRF